MRYRITKSRLWTAQQIATLKAKYPDTPTKDIANEISRELQQCYRMAAKLGLKKSQEYLDSPAACRLRRGDNVGAKTRFTKGQQSWNKGTKGISGTHPNCRKTQFKKGQISRNHLPVGAEVISTDGYRKIKVAEPNVWEFVHRRNWERAHGPIPAGKCIRFKDGDQLNCELANLMLVTRTEHVLYNSKYKFPHEIVPAMAALADLKREITNAEKQTDRSS